MWPKNNKTKETKIIKSTAYLEWRNIHYLESSFEDNQENNSIFTSIILQVRTLLFLLD